MCSRLVSLPLAILFGRAVVQGVPYKGPTEGLRCIVDATWSSLNTWAGAIYYVHRLTGNTHELHQERRPGLDLAEQGRRAQVRHHHRAVKSGSSDDIDRHEEIHIFQAGSSARSTSRWWS